MHIMADDETQITGKKTFWIQSPGERGYNEIKIYMKLILMEKVMK